MDTSRGLTRLLGPKKRVARCNRCDHELPPSLVIPRRELAIWRALSRLAMLDGGAQSAALVELHARVCGAQWLIV